MLEQLCAMNADQHSVTIPVKLSFGRHDVNGFCPAVSSKQDVVQSVTIWRDILLFLVVFMLYPKASRHTLITSSFYDHRRVAITSHHTSLLHRVTTKNKMCWF